MNTQMQDHSECCRTPRTKDQLPIQIAVVTYRRWRSAKQSTVILPPLRLWLSSTPQIRGGASAPACSNFCLCTGAHIYRQPSRHPMQQVLAPIHQRWSHATNTLVLIDLALAGDGVHFIEADVCYDDNIGPYMAHAPSDVTVPYERRLSSWIEYLSRRRKDELVPGVKLDFKMAQAVRSSIEHLHHARYPVWLNADIVKGPRGSVPVFDAAEFIETGLRLPNATLSLGWTTGSVHRGTDAVGYSDEMVDEMLQLCQAPLLLHRPVTFAVRAIDALQSHHRLRRLLSHDIQWSLTIWNGPEGVLVEEEHQIRSAFDSDRTYIDFVNTSI